MTEQPEGARAGEREPAGEVADLNPDGPTSPPAATHVAHATGAPGHVRNPVAVILLSIITIGIYALYWEYASFKELKEYSREGIGGWLGLLFAILLSIVNAFVLPLEVGRLYTRSRPAGSRLGAHRVLGADPHRRRDHLGGEGAGAPERLLGVLAGLSGPMWVRPNGVLRRRITSCQFG